MKSLLVNGFAFAFVLILGIGCRGDRSELPPVHLNPNMDQVERIDPQEPSDVFADGQGMRERVAGTVARRWPHNCGTTFPCTNLGDLIFSPGMMTGRSPDGKHISNLSHIIGKMSKPQVTRYMELGRERFGIYCTPCHDTLGKGKGPVVKYGMKYGMAMPPDLASERIAKLSSGEIFEIISKGIRTMPGYAAQIPVIDRWQIVAYVRALQVAGNTGFSRIPPEVVTKKGWKAPL